MKPGHILEGSPDSPSSSHVTVKTAADILAKFKIRLIKGDEIMR